jgi:hypothetical protein
MQANNDCLMIDTLFALWLISANVMRSAVSGNPLRRDQQCREHERSARQKDSLDLGSLSIIHEIVWGIAANQRVRPAKYPAAANSGFE